MGYGARVAGQAGRGGAAHVSGIPSLAYLPPSQHGHFKAALRSGNASYASPPATPELESHDSR